jgi:hypothetical protein
MFARGNLVETFSRQDAKAPRKDTQKLLGGFASWRGKKF